MTCPNCAAAHPDDAVECPKCGIALAKWRAAQASGVKSTFRQTEGESSPLVLWGGLGVAVLAYWFFFRAPAAPPSVPVTAASAAQAAAPPSAGEWSFSGTVLDLKTLSPAAGAQITFYASGEPSVPVATVLADDNGRYSLKVSETVKGGSYTARISHPSAQGSRLKGSADDTPRNAGVPCAVPKTPGTIRSEARPARRSPRISWSA